jgi:glycosyltransferase involved in cell wall biosynthesis
MIYAVAAIFFAVILVNIYTNELQIRAIIKRPFAKKGPVVGIVSSWAQQGVPYQSKFLAKALSKKHDICVFAFKNYTKDEKDWGITRLEYTKTAKPWKIIRWIKKYGIKVVFFPDRYEDIAVLEWCKKNGVATVIIINYETIKKSLFPHIKKFTTLMCPVKCTYNLLKKHGFKNAVFIRWAVDSDLYSPAKKKIGSVVKFIHNAGWGGAEWRKNTISVVEAFNIATRSHPNIHLILKTQKPLKEYPDSLRYTINKSRNITVIEKDMPLNEMIALYRSAHVSLLPSKWEGIGIPFIESLSMGLPVITVDAPPMNEWVKDGKNGLTAKLAKWDERHDPQFFVKAAIVNVNDLAKCILRLSHLKTIEAYSKRARKSVNNGMKLFTKKTEGLISSLCKK